VPGHGWSADGHGIGDLLHRFGTVSEEAEDLPTVGVPEGVERVDVDTGRVR
jgi:hypothetical protein